MVTCDISNISHCSSMIIAVLGGSLIMSVLLYFITLVMTENDQGTKQ